MDDGNYPDDDFHDADYEPSADELEEKMEVVAQAVRDGKNVAHEVIAECIEYGMNEAWVRGAAKRLPVVPRDVLAYAVKVLKGEKRRQGRQYRPWVNEQGRMLRGAFLPRDYVKQKAKLSTVEAAIEATADERLSQQGNLNPTDEERERLIEKIQHEVYPRKR